MFNRPVHVFISGLRLDRGRVESLEEVLCVAGDRHDVEDEPLGLPEPKLISDIIFRVPTCTR